MLPAFTIRRHGPQPRYRVSFAPVWGSWRLSSTGAALVHVRVHGRLGHNGPEWQIKFPPRQGDRISRIQKLSDCGRQQAPRPIRQRPIVIPAAISQPIPISIETHAGHHEQVRHHHLLLRGHGNAVSALLHRRARLPRMKFQRRPRSQPRPAMPPRARIQRQPHSQHIARIELARPPANRSRCMTLRNSASMLPSTSRQRFSACALIGPKAAAPRGLQAGSTQRAFWFAAEGCVLCLASIRAPEITMSKSLYRVYLAAGLALAAAVTSSRAAPPPPVKPVRLFATLERRPIFIQLREAARTNDAARAAQLAAHIPNYPAPGYVDYFHLKPQLFDSQGHARVDAPDAPVLAFLQKLRRPGHRRPSAQRLSGRCSAHVTTGAISSAILALRAERRHASEMLRARIARGARRKCRGRGACAARRSEMVRRRLRRSDYRAGRHQQFTSRRRLAADPSRLRAELYRAPAASWSTRSATSARSNTVRLRPPARRRC